MFGGLTKTSSRIAIAAALGMTLGGFAMSATPAKAADLGGDCCADLEERVAELEATTVRKGNKKVSVTLSGWVVKLGSWWDDGHEQNFYTGDKDTTLSSHFQISGSATDRSRLVRRLHDRRRSAGQQRSVGFAENQFNDNTCELRRRCDHDISTLLSYMWLKSDRWGTVNWGQLEPGDRQRGAACLTCLAPSSNRTRCCSMAPACSSGPRAPRTPTIWLSNFTGVSVAELPGQMAAVSVPTAMAIPRMAFRYDTPTWGGFSASGGYYEDDVWDVALKYAADWNSIKVSAAAGYTQMHRRRLQRHLADSAGWPNQLRQAACDWRWWGTPFQGFRRDGELFQVGASIMHVPQACSLMACTSAKRTMGRSSGDVQSICLSDGDCNNFVNRQQ